jgi:hypothetical protein
MHEMEWLSLLMAASIVVVWVAGRRSSHTARLRPLVVPSRRLRRRR